jgi:hypothetical protein
MAHYQATVDTPRPPAQAFVYLSDFTTAAEWDPGTVSMVIGFSPTAAIRSPHWRPSFLPTGGHDFSPRPCGLLLVF